ncbi:MAG TPA: nuclear transport factor 2 family protein [Acidimicrobiales bacterium]|nr:nuclear transport factor 2 family protein [Acidimicrobiales bacterium]
MDADGVADANRRYYEAFEAADLDAMSGVWERSERVLCTHPGWSTLRGWSQVQASYFTLFQQPLQMQFLLTREHASVAGDVAWLSLDENLLGDQGGVTIAALNVFVRGADGDWAMVCHHASAVHASVR